MIIVCFSFCVVRCLAQNNISLAGTWHFQLDEENIGIEQQWYKQPFKMTIKMPGTLDDAGIGEPSSLDTNVMEKTVLMKLARKHSYIGPAWYSKEIVIPQSWSNKHIELLLERVIWNTKV